MGMKKGDMPAEPILPDGMERKEEGLAYLEECCRQDVQIEECVLKGVSVSGADFYKLSLKSVLLENCTFLNCNFEKSSFVDVKLLSCDFSNSSLADSYFNRCGFQSVKGVGADFHESLFRDVQMEDCAFSFANLSGSRMETVCMVRCDLQDGYLEECVLKKAVFRGVKLGRANLFHTSLRGMDLRGNEIDGLIVSEEKGELKGAVTDLYQAASLARLLGIIIKDG